MLFSNEIFILQTRIVGSFSGSFSEDYCKQILGLFKPIGEFEIPRKSGTKKELALISPYRVSAMPITEIESNSLAKVKTNILLCLIFVLYLLMTAMCYRYTTK